LPELIEFVELLERDGDSLRQMETHGDWFELLELVGFVEFIELLEFVGIAGDS
jgi:hypothetical protein